MLLTFSTQKLLKMDTSRTHITVCEKYSQAGAGFLKQMLLFQSSANDISANCFFFIFFILRDTIKGSNFNLSHGRRAPAVNKKKQTARSHDIWTSHENHAATKGSTEQLNQPIAVQLQCRHQKLTWFRWPLSLRSDSVFSILPPQHLSPACLSRG